MTAAMAANVTLVSTWFSPWSERVKWVLDHHGIACERIEHVPVIGEGKLRRLAGKPPGRVTVPLLLDGGTILRESWDIAKWADARGTGARLIPPDREEEVRRWVKLADEMSDAGRGLVTATIANSPKALDEALPPAFPSWLRPLLRPIGRMAMGRFRRKYAVANEDEASRLSRMRAGLDALRAGLPSKADAPYLLGAFSYADIAMATMIQGVLPVDDRYIPLGPGTRAAWTREDLARDYPDLIQWRDGIYARHRAGPSTKVRQSS